MYFSCSNQLRNGIRCCQCWYHLVYHIAGTVHIRCDRVPWKSGQSDMGAVRKKHVVAKMDTDFCDGHRLFNCVYLVLTLLSLFVWQFRLYIGRLLRMSEAFRDINFAPKSSGMTSHCKSQVSGPMPYVNGNFRILKWRYISTICLAIWIVGIFPKE